MAMDKAYEVETRDVTCEQVVWSRCCSTELEATMKLRLRWVLSCEARAGRIEMADWQEEFAVPEGAGATKMRAACRRARDAFDVSRRSLEEATLALGRVQHTATSLASDWHTAMEGAREASV